MSAFRTPANSMVDCIESCSACAHLCIETLAWCQARGGRLADPNHVALLTLCTEICNASARAMARGAETRDFLCHACAKVSQRCADSIRMLGNEPQLRACAAACANAARACADMARAPETEFRYRLAS
jgi:hypothetical protein